MLLHFHRKALALESIEGVDSDHIVVDGLTVVETSLQEGCLGIIQLEKGTCTALVAYLGDTMTTLCRSYGVLCRDELLEGRLLLAHAIHQPETKLALCSDTLRCQLTDLNLGGADVITTRTTIIYRHVEREAYRREGAPALAVVEMEFIRSKAILIGKAQRERRHIGHALDVECSIKLATLAVELTQRAIVL